MFQQYWIFDSIAPHLFPYFVHCLTINLHYSFTTRIIFHRFPLSSLFPSFFFPFHLMLMEKVNFTPNTSLHFARLVRSLHLFKNFFSTKLTRALWSPRGFVWELRLRKEWWSNLTKKATNQPNNQAKTEEKERTCPFVQRYRTMTVFLINSDHFFPQSALWKQVHKYTRQ